MHLPKLDGSLIKYISQQYQHNSYFKNEILFVILMSNVTFCQLFSVLKVTFYGLRTF